MYLIIINALLFSILICILNNFLAKFIASIIISKLTTNNDCQKWLESNSSLNFLSLYSQLNKTLYYWFIALLPTSFGIKPFLSLFHGESLNLGSTFSLILMSFMLALSQYILVRLHIYTHCKQQN